MWVRRIDLQIIEPLTNGYRYSEGYDLFKDRLRLIPEAAEGLKNIAQERIKWLDSQIGDKQFIWLKKHLSTDTNTWNILAQQVIFSPLKFMWVTANPDQWDGYLYERDRICDYIDHKDIRNLVVLTGDAHSSWANDIPMDGYRKRSGKNSFE